MEITRSICGETYALARRFTDFLHLIIVKSLKRKEKVIMMYETSFKMLSEEQLLELNGGYKMVSRGAFYMNKRTERSADTVISFIRGMVNA